MQHDALFAALDAFTAEWLGENAPAYSGRSAGEEEQILARLTQFVRATPDCLWRTSVAGHITSSALVVSPDLQQVLLTLHAKLGKWLQLGGHADGEAQPSRVAGREVAEESGLTRTAFLTLPGAGGGGPVPFDLDIHAIPARGREGAHFHYDIRYIIVADPGEDLVISNESKDLRWWRWGDAMRLTSERSMQRQFAKLAWLRDSGVPSPRLTMDAETLRL